MNEPAWSSNDSVRATLAYAAVLGSLAILAIIWFAAPPDRVDRIDGVSRFLQAIVLAVLGWCFGQLGTARAEKRLAESEAAKSRLQAASLALVRNDADIQEENGAAARLMGALRRGPSLQRRIEELLESVKEA